jgi:hypothetical protein
MEVLMSDIPPESSETSDTKSQADGKEKLSPAGQRSLQGLEPVALNKNADAEPEAEQPELAASDPALQAELEEWKRTHDPANWEYKFGSPHDDYQLNKDLQASERQHEIGRQASTADSLSDAIDTTLAAHRNSQDENEETPMDHYFREKYGRHPYTTDAYPKDKETS